MMDLVKFVVDLFEKKEIEELSLPEIIQRSKQVVFEVSSANQIRSKFSWSSFMNLQVLNWKIRCVAFGHLLARLR